MKILQKIASFILLLSMLITVTPQLSVMAYTFDTFTLPDAVTSQGGVFVLQNIENYVSADKIAGLEYASDVYEGQSRKHKVTFKQPNFAEEVSFSQNLIKKTGDNSYNLVFDVPKTLSGGNYIAVINVYTAHEANINSFEFIIENFSVEDNTKDYYEIHIKNYCAPHAQTISIENFQNYVTPQRLSSLLYVSDYYDIEEKTVVDYYIGADNVNPLTYDSGLLKYNGNDNYTLDIPIWSTSKDNVKIVINLPVAANTGRADAKPYKIIIDNFCTTQNGTYPTDYKAFLPDLYVDYQSSGSIRYSDLYLPDYVAEKLKNMVANASSSGLDTRYTFKRKGGTIHETTWDNCLPVSYKNNNYELDIIYSSSVTPGKYYLTIDIGYNTTNMGFLKELTLYFPNYTMRDNVCEWDDGVITTSPSCLEAGSKTFTCKNCGETRTEVLNATGHNFGNWTVSVPPTDTALGTEKRKCSNCDTVETRDIYPQGYKNTIFKVSDTTNLEAIHGAEVFVTSEDGTFSEKNISDSLGVADFDLADGIYSVQVIKSGYQLRNFTVEKHDTQNTFDIYLNKNDLISVNTQVKEMSRKEIIAAGIDINAPENQHVYECITVLRFTPEASGDININPVEVNLKYYYIDGGIVLNPKGEYVPGGPIVYPVSKDIFLIVYSKTTWLKEMFDVQLVAANTSSIETIENCMASLTLPDGLSFAKMVDYEQSTDVNFGNIAPLSTKEHHWYLCGDKPGEYYIDGTVSGTRVSGAVKEFTKTNFTTAEPVCVLAGDAMHLLIEAEKTAVPNTPYRMRYTLKNVSKKTINNISLYIPGGKFCKEYDIQNVVHNIEIGNFRGLTGTFNDGYQLSDESFEPGEILQGVFEITFGQGVETEDVTYMVTNMFTITGKNSTTVIPTDISLVDNIEKHRYNSGTIITGATCTHEGEIRYACVDENCDNTKTVTLTLKDHSLGSWKIRQDSTCTNTGIKYRACENCTYTITAEIPKKAHSYKNGKIVTMPTLTTAGTILYECSECHAKTTESLLLNAGAEKGWKLFDNGLLIVSDDDTSWAEHAAFLKVVYFEEGVTKITGDLFSQSADLTEVYIPSTISQISDNAFANCPNLKKIYYNGSREQLGEIMSLGDGSVNDEIIAYGKPSIKYSNGEIEIFAPNEETIMLVAVYNSGRFTGYKRIKVKNSMKKPLEDLGLSVENASALKAFLWKEITDISPVCTPQDITLGQ